MNGTLTFDYDKIERAAVLLNHIQVTGVGQARILSELGGILEEGRPYGPESGENDAPQESVGHGEKTETADAAAGSMEKEET